MPADDILSSLGLGEVADDRRFAREPGGTVKDSAGAPVVFASSALLRGLHRVLEGERAGAWTSAMKIAGIAGGRALAGELDATLAASGQPALAALPLEACLVLLERTFANRGWGRLKLDLADAAEHGVVVARVANSCFVEALADVEGLVDPFLAGVLQGFFEQISGQTLGCEEIVCVRTGAPECVFVITAPERFSALEAGLGRESAEKLIARLRA